MTNQDLARELMQLSVYANATPNEKLFVGLQKEQERIRQAYNGSESKLILQLYAILINRMRKELRGDNHE